MTLDQSQAKSRTLEAEVEPLKEKNKRYKSKIIMKYLVLIALTILQVLLI